MRLGVSVLSQQNTLRKYLPWLIWFFAALGVPYQFLLQSSTSVMIPALMQGLKMSSAEVGFLSSSFFYTYLLLQVPAGLLVDRFGARLVLSIGIFACALACLGFAYAPTVWTAIFFRLLMGVVTAPAVAAGMSVAAHWFPPKKFAMIAGMTEMIGMLGGAFGEIYLARLVDHLGWRSTLYFCFIAGLVLAFFMACCIRNHPAAYTEHKKRHKASFLSQLHCVLKLPQAWANGLYCGFMFAAMPIFAGMWAVPYLQSRFGFSLETAAIGSALMFVGSAMGSPFWGWLSDHIEKRKRVMIFAALLNLLITIAFFNIRWTSGLSFFFTWAMGFSTGVYILAFAATKDQTPARVRGTAMAFVNMMSMLLGAWLLEPLVGLILQYLEPAEKLDHFTTHDFSIALISMPLCVLAALLTSFFIKETGCACLEH